MKTALYVAVYGQKTRTTQQSADLQNFLGTASDLVKSDPHAEQLNAGTFLLNLNDGIGTLAALSFHASRYGVESRVLFFEDAPAWLPVFPVNA